jgi:hypothetical protein
MSWSSLAIVEDFFWEFLITIEREEEEEGKEISF